MLTAEADLLFEIFKICQDDDDDDSLNEQTCRLDQIGSRAQEQTNWS